MVERVEMSRRNVVVDGKVYSVKRESEPVFLLRRRDRLFSEADGSIGNVNFGGKSQDARPSH